MGRFAVSVSLLLQSVFLSLAIATGGTVHNVLFSLFWIFTVATLVFNITEEYWSGGDWVVFGALASSLITGVLISLDSVVDVVGLGVSVFCLLFVASFVNALPSRKRRVRRRSPMQGLSKLFYSVPGAGLYHRRGCRVLQGRDDLEGYFSEEEAKRAGKEPCRICI